MALALCCLCHSSMSIVAEDECQRPGRPTLSGVVQDDLQVAMENGIVKTFLGSSVQYLQCLTTFARKNAETLTQQERASLKDKYKAHVGLVRGVATSWNERYSAYHARQ